MKLGLDIHGVVDTNPEFFRFMANAFMSFGAEVHIITGGSLQDGKIRAELDRMRIPYNEIFSVHDHLKKIGAKTNEELGIASRYPFPDETWNKVKAEYCKKHKIDMHIDDMLEYTEYFTTPYMIHKDKNRNHRGEFGEHKEEK